MNTFPPNSERISSRRYDLDWLRVIAFGLLILYHIGMYYVHDWGWHIKSDVTSTALQDLMILTNPWRMSLLFFISGMALALVSQKTAAKYSVFSLAKLRTSRLLVPLIFGMFVIVAPQVYIEALDRQLISPGFINFWAEYINPNTQLLTDKHSIIGLLTWNHLWFLPYLWVYSLILLLFLKPLSALSQVKWLKQTPLSFAILMLIAILIAIWLALRTQYPTTHDLINDWYNHGKYFLMFTVGFVFAIQKVWWNSAIKHKYILLCIALLAYGLMIADRHGAFPALASEFQTNIFVKIGYGIVFSANIWCWIFAVLGLTGAFLPKPSKALAYANKAVLPWYMLHQTLIVMFAWWLKPYNIHPSIEFPLLLTLTVAGCVLGYEVIRRVPLLGWLCGTANTSKQKEEDLPKTKAVTAS